MQGAEEQEDYDTVMFIWVVFHKYFIDLTHEQKHDWLKKLFLHNDSESIDQLASALYPCLGDDIHWVCRHLKKRYRYSDRILLLCWHLERCPEEYISHDDAGPYEVEAYEVDEIGKFAADAALQCVVCELLPCSELPDDASKKTPWARESWRHCEQCGYFLCWRCKRPCEHDMFSGIVQIMQVDE